VGKEKLEKPKLLNGTRKKTCYSNVKVDSVKKSRIVSEIVDFGGKAIFMDALRMASCLRSLRRVLAIQQP
jgi:hypothetical protein